MTALRRFFGNWWVLSVLIAAVVALVLVVLLPFLISPLRDIAWRLGLLALVSLTWAGFAGFRIFAARRASDRIADALAHETVGASESAVLQERMSEAMSRLKHEQGGRRDYLYSRPWWVIVGPPAAGKTTAILNSGLRFPFSDQRVKGVGGTRDLDFMFADEAVIVDTAGRYTSQDSSADRDREGWLKFLDLLRKSRPLQPINGVIVAIGIDTLLAANVREIDRNAELIRRRLFELRQGLEVTAPVYVLFTKSDLMAGFIEFFDDLDVDQRRAVLGSTFPVGDAPPNATQIARAFDEVAQAVADRGSTRLQDELDMRRRGVILGFPAQFAGLRDAVARLLEGAFPTSAREGTSLLRGFYFTSGLQQGAPLDRLMGATASVFDAPAPPGRTGRAYFLNRLLLDVIFGEAGLVQGTATVRARRGALLTTGLVGIATLSALILVVWIASLITDLNYQGDLKTKADAVYVELQPFKGPLVSESDPGLADAEQVLSDLRALPDGYGDRHGAPAERHTQFGAWFGVHDGGLGKQASDSYLAELRRIMLPRIMLRLERVQRDAVVVSPDTATPPNDASGGDLYEALKVYLMLGGGAPGHFDEKTIRSWVTEDWAIKVMPSADDQKLRDELAVHLDALLGDKEDISNNWQGSPLLHDLIDRSRRKLHDVRIENRAYAILKENMVGPDWRPNLPDAELVAFANSDEIKNFSIPYAFTKDGYEKAFNWDFPKISAQLVSDDRWVLQVETEADASALQRVPSLYAHEYENWWNQFLMTPRPGNYFNPSSTDALNALAEVPASPLRKLLNLVVGQTSLANGPQLTSNDAGAQVTNTFAPLASYVAQGKVEALVDAINKMASTDTALAGSATASGAGPAPVETTAALLEASRGAPPTLRSFVDAISKGGASAGAGASVSQMKNFYLAQVKDVCDRATRGFPFNEDAADDADMAGVRELVWPVATSPAGSLDQILTGLSPDIEDTQASLWRWKAILVGAAPPLTNATAGQAPPPTDPTSSLDPGSAERLREVAEIKSLLRPDGFFLEVTADEVGVSSATLTIGDSVHTLTPGQSQPAEFRWNSTSTSPGASLAIAGRPDQIAAGGGWALFRLFHLAQTKTFTSGPSGGTLTLRYGGASQFVTLHIKLPPGVPDPRVEAPGGPWAFRCPATL